jgi:GntR family transcriptional regulator
MIQIDTQSREPLIDQVMQALKDAIASGELGPGQELPSARQLGGDLGVHWNTVARAYRQLSDVGLLFVAHGRKTCVKDFSKVRGRASKKDREEVRKHLRQALTQAQLVGLDIAEMKTLFARELKTLASHRKE